MPHEAWDMLLSEEDSIDKWMEKIETLVKKAEEEFVPKKSSVKIQPRGNVMLLSPCLTKSEPNAEHTKHGKSTEKT